MIDPINASIQGYARFKIARHEHNFPEGLREANDQIYSRGLTGFKDVLTLHGRGSRLLLRRHHDRFVAVVGTRRPCAEAYKAAFRIGRILAAQDYVVVSGLALGCDTAAFEGALSISGRCVGVLAHGLHMVYPWRNMGLAEKVLSKRGTLVSEYPPGTPVERKQFVHRDRVQAALACVVVVIQTSATGGTMHTVRTAQSLGRTVLVPFYSSSRNKPLNQELGKVIPDALVVRTPEDLIDHLQGSSNEHIRASENT